MLKMAAQTPLWRVGGALVTCSLLFPDPLAGTKNGGCGARWMDGRGS